MRIMTNVKGIWEFMEKSPVFTVLIFLVACATRLYKLNVIPGGIHVDEAYAAYNAWSMLEYGVDSWGYHNPVYFIAWGGGMNVLNSYLMSFFIRLMGMSLVSIRLPQAIISCLAVIAFYYLLKEVFDRKMALLGTFLLAVCPWHIVMSRLNIESSLLADFLIFGTCFFVKGLEKHWLLVVSAVMYGLSLYTYAVIWPVLPFIILADGAYAVWNRKIKLNDIWVIASIIILGLLALPLVLFMFVNMGVIDEIKTGFISIPQLVYMRTSDISLKSLPDNLINLFNVLSRQQTSNDMNSFAEYGLFYKFSNWFYLIGGCILINRMYESLKRRRYDACFYLGVWLVALLALGLMLPRVSIIRLNGLFPMIVCCMAIGIMAIADRWQKGFAVVMVLVYCGAFLSFQGAYRKNYNGYVSDTHQQGVQESLELAGELTDGIIYVDSGISFSKILYYSQMPVCEFIDTVEYADYPGAYMEASSYGRFRIYDGQEITDGMVVIMLTENAEGLDEAAYDIEENGVCAVVKKK